MPSSETQFKPGQPSPARGVRRRQERYADQIVRAEDLMAEAFPDAARAAIAIAKGEAVEYLINHKTGEVHEVRVNPATQLKAIQFVTERVAGKPEQTKTHELGDGAAGVFSVLLGKAAQEHWSPQALPDVEAPALEAAFTQEV